MKSEELRERKSGALIFDYVEIRLYSLTMPIFTLHFSLFTLMGLVSG